MKTFKLVTLVFVLLGGTAFVVSAVQKNSEGVKLNATEMPVPFDIPAFNLQMTDGQPFTRDSLLGKYTVLFFGFTRCPDACPTTLAQWRSEIPKLSSVAQDKVQFILVSVDPEHDKLEVLKTYVEGFHTSIKSATGEDRQLHRLADAMKTTFHKEEESAGDPDLYMMAHSPRYYLINPEAELQAVYNPPIDSGVLAGDLNRLAEKSAKKGVFF